MGEKSEKDVVVVVEEEEEEEVRMCWFTWLQQLDLPWRIFLFRDCLPSIKGIHPFTGSLGK
jgi:hypothetical protein